MILTFFFRTSIDIRKPPVIAELIVVLNSYKVMGIYNPFVYRRTMPTTYDAE